MRIPEAWLREMVHTDLSIERIADVLTMAGLEVEEVETAAPPFIGVRLGKILSAQKHPDADRLQVCEVSIGSGSTPLQIVCGAPNARAGLMVACATDGALLPGGFKIKQAKMRGVVSQGMLCSAKELGISEASEGILEVDASEASLGEDIRQTLSLDAATLVLKLTPNRGDCLSMLGVARELSALLGVPLSTPSWS
ncbi:MAG TPA: phenylalanine--tRNA ligase subunit beta, partial [Burkholderiaceae bacterium]|nr:phenylalanine--tRNA ligase subunit beta [Burkholderiaceae bacterium]